MPRIKQTKMRLGLDHARPNLETVVYVNYDNSDVRGYKATPKERFWVELPEVVAGALGLREVRGKDQAEAEQRFKEAIERFKHLNTEVNRVILYDIRTQPDPENPPNRYRSEASAYQVEVWAGTYEETVAIAGDGARRYTYSKVDSPLTYPGERMPAWQMHDAKRIECQVPWTEQNQAFFVWIQERMVELISRMADIRKPEKLVEAINAGRLLPLGRSEQYSSTVSSPG